MRRPTRREFAATVAAAPLSPAAPAPAARQPRNLLSTAWPPDKLARALAPREQWRPFPTAADRAAWDTLPEEVRRNLVAAAEPHRNAQWPVLPATLFLEYARNGNRSNYERVRNRRRNLLSELVIAECLEGRGRFLDDIVNGIWLTCEETYWGVPAHIGVQKAGVGLPDAAEPTVDLFAGETSSLLAWTSYLLGPQLDRVSPLVHPRIRLEVERRILAPNRERIDFRWMGLDPKLGREMNNWNPWINSNWLTSVLLLEEDDQRRVAAVHKILRSLDRFLDSYHDDGGCDEGPGYWFRAGGSLFDCLELLHSASSGRIDFYGVPQVGEIAKYIYRVHIDGDWFVNFADASAKVGVAGDLVYRYGQRIGDEKMQAFGAWAFARRGNDTGRTESIGRHLPALFDLSALRGSSGRPPLVRDVWLPGIQVVVARRKDGSADGLYLAAQGGHNAESHNHNDVGNFIVFADGQPLFIDVGVETYTAKTFSPRRYEIWTMQSAWHNLPTIDGVMQAAGRSYAARNVSHRADDQAAEFRLDIAAAYPAEAGIDSWERTLRLDRVKNEIEVLDRYALKRAAGKITLTLMTPWKPVPAAPGELRFDAPGLRSGAVRALFDAGVLKAATEEIPIEDSRLKGAWGDRLYRVLLTAANPPRKADWRLRIAQA